MQKFELINRGAFTALKASLSKGDKLKAEAGAMVSMDSTLSITGKLDGGLLGGLGRMLSGEKFFLQTIYAEKGDGEVILAPSATGDILPIELDGSVSYNIQKDGFFAGSESLKVSTKTQNLLKGLFSGEGFFIVKVEGTGTLFMSSFGAIEKIEIPDGKDYIVDNGHLVAWPDNMQYSIEKASKSLISSFTSGEGFVTKFRGPGTVYIQTRNASAFGGWLGRFLPKK